MRARLRKIAVGTLLAWMVSSWLALFAGMVLNATGSLRWLELPWSDARDFLELSDGRVCVDSFFFARILCYDRSGRFAASYPEPIRGGGGSRGLAIDERGRVFYRVRNSVVRVDNEFKKLEQFSAKDVAVRTWVLGAEGSPEFAPLRGEPPTSSAPVAAGQVLFGRGFRERFSCADGDELRWEGRRLVRWRGGQRVADYGAPWYLAWAAFPWPSALGCAATFVFAGILELRARSRRRGGRDAQTGPRPVGRGGATNACGQSPARRSR